MICDLKLQLEENTRTGIYLCSSLTEMDLQYIEISTKQGKLKGQIKMSEGFSKKIYNSFQGIPYAKPPVGKLRFKAPEPFRQWEGVLEATKEGNDTVQKHTIFQNLTGDEDCLYLNVYTTQPGKVDAKRAVMVWIHGGSFNSGSGSSELYGPDFLIEEDIVLVTINYRCGALGFLSLENDKLPGNLGLKDQTMALMWVQEYIDSFGGDPNNVTIFGESAGGASVHYHLLSPLSKGLFHKAILQSGFTSCPWAFQSRPKEKALCLARELGCTSQDLDEVLDFFMSIPAISIVNAEYQDTIHTEEEKDRMFVCHFTPCMEVAGNDPFLPYHPSNMMERGEFSKVPIITGVTDKEGLIYLAIKKINIKKVNEDLSLILPINLDVAVGSAEGQKLCKMIMKFYTNQEALSWDVMHRYVDCLTDIGFAIGLEDFRQNYLKYTTSTVYSYQFSYTSSRALFSFMMPLAYPDKAVEFVGSGASHADDLGYLFKSNMSQIPFIPPTSEDQVFMTKLLKAWTTFAKTGNPNCEDLGITWKPDSIENPHYLDMGALWKSVEGDLFPKRMEFWNKIYEKYSKS